MKKFIIDNKVYNCEENSTTHIPGDITVFIAANGQPELRTVINYSEITEEQRRINWCSDAAANILHSNYFKVFCYNPVKIFTIGETTYYCEVDGEHRDGDETIYHSVDGMLIEVLICVGSSNAALGGERDVVTTRVGNKNRDIYFLVVKKETHKLNSPKEDEILETVDDTSDDGSNPQIEHTVVNNPEGDSYYWDEFQRVLEDPERSIGTKLAYLQTKYKISKR